MEGSIPPEAQAMIGRYSTPHSYLVTERDILHFAQAIGDPNPLFYDKDYAKRTEWGGVIAPPLFFYTFAYEDVPESGLPEDGLPCGDVRDVPLPANRAMGGAADIELGEPIRPGDTITVTKKLVDVYSKAGKSGTLYFIVMEFTYTNQKGQLVAHEQGTLIQR